MLDTTGLVDAVAAQKGFVPSVKTAFAELFAKLDAALAHIPAAQAIVSQAATDILAHNQELADAIVANPGPGDPVPGPGDPNAPGARGRRP